MAKHNIKPNYRRRLLRLPDLDHCKRAVLNSLGSPASRRVYEYAIDQFIAWYCSEPRLAFNRIVVVRYRMHLESRGLAANTINQQLAAVRRLAHEAADAGLLSPELAAGISRVRGVKQLGHIQGVLRHSRVATTTDVYMQEIPESVQKTVDAISAELRLLPSLEEVTPGTSVLLPNATKLKSGVSAST
jgi:hypothetical protein